MLPRSSPLLFDEVFGAGMSSASVLPLFGSGFGPAGAGGGGERRAIVAAR